MAQQVGERVAPEVVGEAQAGLRARPGGLRAGVVAGGQRGRERLARSGGARGHELLGEQQVLERRPVAHRELCGPLGTRRSRERRMPVMLEQVLAGERHPIEIDRRKAPESVHHHVVFRPGGLGADRQRLTQPLGAAAAERVELVLGEHRREALGPRRGGHAAPPDAASGETTVGAGRHAAALGPGILVFTPSWSWLCTSTTVGITAPCGLGGEQTDAVGPPGAGAASGLTKAPFAVRPSTGRGGRTSRAFRMSRGRRSRQVLTAQGVWS